EQEPPPTRVPERPDQVADPLEPEHRIEDEERDDRLAPRRVRGAGGGERRHRPRLGDPFLEDLALARLAIRKEQLRVHWLIHLAEGRIDLVLTKERVEPERASLVGNDRYDARTDGAVAQQVAQEARERRRRADADAFARTRKD